MTLPLELGSYHLDPTLGSLERQLTCPICLEVFTKPVVILPCQHNLCRKCANELFQVGVGGRFRCPSCRHEVVLDRHGVYGLQRNLLVESIIDIYKQQSASSRPSPKGGSHLTCEEHEDEKVNIYCLSCHVPTCSLCKVFGAHKACQVAPVTEVYQEQKTELSDGIGSLVAANDHVQAFIMSLEEICKNIEENSESQKQTLCGRFDRMYNILEERRKIMMQTISYEQEEKSGRAQGLVQACRERVEANSKLVETALHTMEEPEMAAFLQTARSLIEKVSEASRATTVETLEPGFENMDHYKVDFSAEERALCLLDFVKMEDEVQEDPAEPESQHEAGPEPESGLDGELIWEPEVEMELKEDNLGARMGDAEESSGQGEGCSKPKKEFLREHKGPNTQQDEPERWLEQPGAGALDMQGCLAQASDDATFYPGWHRSSGWQLGNPSLPTCGRQQEGADAAVLVAREPPSSPAGANHPSASPEDLDGQLAQGSPDSTGTLGLVSLGAKENSEHGEPPAGQVDMTSPPQQAISLFFYIMALAIIFQRLWGYIQCIICPE